MRKIDPDALSAGQQWRLRIALDRVMPPFSPPRYRMRRTSGIASWRIAPASLALALAGVFALTAYAATGSANPAVWGQSAESAIKAVRLVPATEPVPPAPVSNQPAQQRVAPATTAKSTSTAQRPQPSNQPEAPDGDSETTAASGARHDSDPPSPSPSPSPRYWDH